MRKFAIADIHGCAKTFKALIHKLKLTKQDKLFLLGDYINKGPSSREVLEQITELQSESDVIVLRGNHDQSLIDAVNGAADTKWKTEEQRILTLESFRVKKPEDIPAKYIDMVYDMPLYHEEEENYLVHAGFNFDIEDPFSDEVSMLNIKEFTPDPDKIKNKGIIHGHIPWPLDKIKDESAEKVTGIDAGCAYYKDQGFGNLVAMNIATRELIVQKNIDYPYKGGSKNS